MTVKQLDRLISKMELDGTRKKMLRDVRKAVMSGRTGDAEVGHASWSVSVDSVNGTPFRINFRFKREE